MSAFPEHSCLKLKRQFPPYMGISKNAIYQSCYIKHLISVQKMGKSRRLKCIFPFVKQHEFYSLLASASPLMILPQNAVWVVVRCYKKMWYTSTLNIIPNTFSATGITLTKWMLVIPYSLSFRLSIFLTIFALQICYVRRIFHLLIQKIYNHSTYNNLKTHKCNTLSYHSLKCLRDLKKRIFELAQTF